MVEHSVIINPTNLRCSCGWAAYFDSPRTMDFLNQLAEDHKKQAYEDELEAKKQRFTKGQMTPEDYEDLSKGFEAMAAGFKYMVVLFEQYAEVATNMVEYFKDLESQ